jgi:hypothetical protein
VTLSPPSSHTVTTADISSGAAVDGTVLTADGAGGSAFEAASGGLVVLSDQTLVLGAAVIDTGAGGIAQTATNLVVRMLLRTNQAAEFSTVLIRLNNSSAAIYDESLIQNINATVTGTPLVGQTSWFITTTSANSLASVFTAVYLDLPFYTATTAFKAADFMWGAGGDDAAETFLGFAGGDFRSTAAITRMAVLPQAGGVEFLAGSRLQVLGSI